MKTIRTRILCGAAAVAMLAMAGQTQAANLVVNGEFNMFKPGTGYTITGTFINTGSFVGNTWGNGAPVSGAGVVFSDSTMGTTVDIPGWTSVRGSKNLYTNGFDGALTPAFHAFGSWGGQTLIQSASSLATVQPGVDYTITVQVGGPGSPSTGPIAGPLEFDLLANGVALTPSSSIGFPVSPDGSSWYTVSRTYDADSLAGNIGQALTVQLGVGALNAIPNRVVFDNVTLTATPEPSSILLIGLGALAMLRRRR